MTTESQYARFGSGKSVRRVEDETLLKGAGLFADDATLPRPGLRLLSALAASARANRRHRHDGGSGTARRHRHRDRRRPRPRGRQAAAAVGRLQARRRLADGVPAAACACGRHRPLRGRGRGRRDRAGHRAGARRDGSRRRSLRARCRAWWTPPTRSRPARRWCGRRRPATSPAKRGTATPPRREAAFAKAAHVVALDLVNQRLAPCPIEPRAILASYDAATDRITLRVSNQTPTGLRDALCAEVLGIPNDKVRVQVGDVGGGFGMKTGLYPEDVVLAFARANSGGRSSGAPSGWRNSWRRPTDATCAARPSWRSTRTDAFSRCASPRSPTSAPTRRRPASSSSC